LRPERRAHAAIWAEARKALPAERSILESEASPGQGLSPADFARALLELAGAQAGGLPARELHRRLKLRGPLIVNGRPAALAEIRQAAWRLMREGLASFDGDTLRPA
jgi:hypothetical protein